MRNNLLIQHNKKQGGLQKRLQLRNQNWKLQKNGTQLEKPWTYKKTQGCLASISSIAGMPTTSSQSERHFSATAGKVAIYSYADNLEFSVVFVTILKKNLRLIFLLLCYAKWGGRGGLINEKFSKKMSRKLSFLKESRNLFVRVTTYFDFDFFTITILFFFYCYLFFLFS